MRRMSFAGPVMQLPFNRPGTIVRPSEWSTPTISPIHGYEVMFWQPDSDEFISQGYVGHVKVLNGKTLICCVCYV